MNVRTFSRTVAATAFAALLVFAAGCTSTATDTAANDDFGHVNHPDAATAEATTPPAGGPIPGPAKVDSDGNVYSSSAAPGTGNASTIGTNTNVNTVPERSTTQITETTVTETPVTPVTTTPVTTVTETRTETTVPMTSATQETTQTTERRRLRKD